MITIAQRISAVVPGCYYPVKFKKDFKRREGAQVTKVTKGVYRLGISARSIASYDYKNAGLKGKEWLVYPFLLQGKEEALIRLNRTLNPFQKPTVEWFVEINGEVRATTKEEALEKGWVVPSEVNPKPFEAPFFDVKLSNIISIG